MESEFHFEFSQRRVGKDDVVYSDISEMFKELDEFCDVDKMIQPRGPLILFGVAGSGKSALIANWIAKRKRESQSYRLNATEFVFYHAVGCTRQSIYVEKLLSRVLTEINEFFEFAKEIPTMEEKLNWQFPRFLEAASKKGRIILIIDGLHRLRASEGEGVLRWLPLSFPSNVRVIFTATNVVETKAQPLPKDVNYVVPRCNTAQAVVNRVQIEAARRKWKELTTRPLRPVDRRHLIITYLQKQDGRTNGLQLFPIQQEALSVVPQTENPLFFNLMLTALTWAAEYGFDIHTCFNEWILCDSVHSLYESMLRIMENGYTRNERSSLDAQTMLCEQSLNNEGNKVKIRHISKSYSKLQRTVEDWKDDVKANSMDESAADQEECIENTTAAFGFDETSSQSSSNAPMENDDMEEQVESIQIEADQGSTEEVQEVEEESADSIHLYDTPDENSQFSYTKTNVNFNVDLTTFPVYLKGGQDVLGLKLILGKALSLLYVARHGLHDSELRALVHTLCSENSDEDKEYFDDTMWDMLLNSLQLLGVIEHRNIFILCSCFETLREIIWWRYIGNCAGEQRYHQFLIQHFHDEPTSFRRVEELPWHLSTCKRWPLLRDVLTDITMFRLMFTANFKTELFSYWSTLSASPLPASKKFDSAETGHSIAPYDLIREYSKGINDWRTITKPSTAGLTALLQVMTRFIFEYCEYTQHEFPVFNHPALEFDCFSEYGIVMPEPPSSGATVEPQALYLYNRWIWIQFPWLALSNKLVLKENECIDGTPDNANKKSKALKLQKNELVDQASWNLTKKSVTDANKNPSKIGKIHGIIHTTIQPVRVDAAELIKPTSEINRKMRRSSTMLAIRNITNVITGPKSGRRTRKLTSSQSTKTLPPIEHGVDGADRLGTPEDKKNMRLFQAAGDRYHDSATEWDIKKDSNFEVVFKIKNIFNQLALDNKKKGQLVRKLKTEIKDLKDAKTQSLDRINQAETAMQAMMTRSKQMDEAVQKIGLQGALLKRVIHICHKFPAGDNAHLLNCKKRLKIFVLQGEDLSGQLGALKFGNTRIERKEIPSLEEEYAKRQKLYEKIVSNVEKTKSRLVADRGLQDKLYTRRKSVVGDSARLNKAQQLFAKAPANEAKDIANTSTESYKDPAHMRDEQKRVEKACDKVRKGTGISNLDVIYHKFINGTELSQSLDEQTALYELRLKSMRENQAIIELELQNLEFEQATIKVEDVRTLEEHLYESELQRDRATLSYSGLSSMYKESMIGIGQIAQLVGVRSVEKPRSNMVAARDLWPLTNTKLLTAELCACSTSTLEKLLKVLDERVSSITEKLEHGRGDPDEHFSVTRNANSTRRRSKHVVQASPSIQASPSKPKGLSKQQSAQEAFEKESSIIHSDNDRINESNRNAMKANSRKLTLQKRRSNTEQSDNE